MTTFADRLKSCRELLDLSQTELAEKTGMDTSLINHYEAGRREPNLDNLKRLRRALHVPYEMLLGN